MTPYELAKMIHMELSPVAPKLSAAIQLVAAKDQTTATPAAMPQATCRGRARKGAWASAQPSSKAARTAAIAKGEAPISPPRS